MHLTATGVNIESALHGLGLNNTSVNNAESITNSSNEQDQTDTNLEEQVHMLIIVIK